MELGVRHEAAAVHREHIVVDEGANKRRGLVPLRGQLADAEGVPVGDGRCSAALGWSLRSVGPSVQRVACRG